MRALHDRCADASWERLARECTNERHKRREKWHCQPRASAKKHDASKGQTSHPEHAKRCAYSKSRSTRRGLAVGMAQSTALIVDPRGGGGFGTY